MKEVLVRTKPKDSFTLVVSDNSANIQTTFSPPLDLQANRDYELATYYSSANIRKGNNSVKWSVDEGLIVETEVICFLALPAFIVRALYHIHHLVA